MTYTIPSAKTEGAAGHVSDHELIRLALIDIESRLGAGGTVINNLDDLPLSVPGTITWNGSSWPARTTATASSSRRVIWVGNPGGSGPTDRATNDVWTAG